MKFEILKAKRENCPVILDFIKILAIYEKLEHEVTADIPLLEKTLFEISTAFGPSSRLRSSASLGASVHPKRKALR